LVIIAFRSTEYKNFFDAADATAVCGRANAKAPLFGGAKALI
jgi:hypothetical protein